MRERFALNIAKTIYQKTVYPSNKGEFERAFMLFCDSDFEVERILKINEHHHSFAHLKYIRSNGLLSSYCPDFLIKINNNIFLVETKAKKRYRQYQCQAKAKKCDKLV